MEESNAQVRQTRGPRLYHKKSRTGCQRCKQRRVKCNEERPACGGCTKHGVTCVYLSQPAKDSVAAAAPAAKHGDDQSVGKETMMTTPSSESSMAMSPPNPQRVYPSPGSSNHTSHYVDDTDPSLGLPDGEWRRLWEMRLLFNSSSRMNTRVGSSGDPSMKHIFQVEEPELALYMAQHRNRHGLLYIVLAHSALSLWTSSTDKQERHELLKLQRTYQALCSKEQRRDIDDIATADSKLLDYISFTSLKILAHSMALVQTLSLDPWEPPVQWLHMGHGAGQVWLRSLKFIREDPESLMRKFVNGAPRMSEPTETILSDHSRLAWLLDHPAHPSSIEAQTDQELNDERARDVYHQALGYICSILRAQENGEADYVMIRRLGGFSVWVPIDFSTFLEERRPRALVILAHLMSIWMDYEHSWMIGKAGEWQIRCIYKNLPVEWASKLDGLFSKFRTNNLMSLWRGK